MTFSPSGRNLEISLSNLLFPTSKTVQYAYFLENTDADWNLLDAGKHILYYNNLVAGTHHLWVKTRDEQGVWSSPQMLLRVTRQPNFQETWIFQLILFALLSGIAYLAIHSYIKPQNKTKAPQTYIDHLISNYQLPPNTPSIHYIP